MTASASEGVARLPARAQPTHAPELRAVLGRAVKLLRPYRGETALCASLVAVWTGTVLGGPLIIRHAIDHGIVEKNLEVLKASVVAYVLLAIVAYVIHRIQIRLLSRIGESVLRDLRLRVFEHLQRLSLSFYDREKAGVIVSRMTNDVDSLQELVQMGLLMLVSSTLLLGISIVVLAVVSWQMLLCCLVALPFVVAASVQFQRASHVAYLKVRDQIGNTLSRLQEGIAGVRVIQAFAREEEEKLRFARENAELYRAHIVSAKIQAWYLPVIELAGLGTTALVVGIGGWMVGAGLETIGTVTFFVLALSSVFEPIQQMSQLFNQLQSAGAALVKLFTLLDTPVDVDERPGARVLPTKGALRVENTSFRYRPELGLALEGVDLEVAPGERIALLGPTGAGKSTLAKLIARLYDPTDGSVSFGSVDLRDATLASLRRQVVLVPQEGFLFNSTIRENVRVARPGASDAEVDRALAAIGVSERFSELPEGLDTEVNERGSRLSAGEKQLVSLARTALVDPAVLVLDEATSSLDPGTEAVVEAAVHRLMEGRTVIVVAHRLSTAQRADRIGVVVGGKLAELGTHVELRNLDGHYAALLQKWVAGGGTA